MNQIWQTDLSCRLLSWVRDTLLAGIAAFLMCGSGTNHLTCCLKACTATVQLRHSYLMQWAPAAVVAAVLLVSDSAMVIVAILDLAIVMIPAAASQLCEQP